MTTPEPLPDKPSLEFERKQAKALVKGFKVGDRAAIERVRAHLPQREKPIGLRDAQLVIAREYGFSGWVALKAAILEMAGGLEWAAQQARAAIHDDDRKKLRKLLRSHPELLSWRDPETGDVLLQATTSYANFPGAEHEAQWNRLECAELLLEQDAVVEPRVWLRMLDTGAHAMLALFARQQKLPSNLRTLAALGDVEAVRGCFAADGRLLDAARPAPELRAGYEQAAADWPLPEDDAHIVADAVLYACRLGQREVAEELLARCIAFDPELGQRIAAWQGEAAFLEFLCAQVPEAARHAASRWTPGSEHGLVWQCAIELRLRVALGANDADTVREILAGEPFLRSVRCAGMLARLIETASYSSDRLAVIEAVLSSGGALTTMDTPPPSRAISYALEYGNAPYVPALLRVWPLRDDLPHAAGMGDQRTVDKWFAGEQPALGDPAAHHPFHDHAPTMSVQDVLDRALAWAVQNAHYEVADSLLRRGADINTRWSTHEPASILHECAFAGRVEQVQYLVSRGIDVTITDHRYDATAEGWARFAGHEEIAEYLAGQV